ncbi:MAG: hypothetical protein AAFX39_08990 [Pseudomonadota bacterium]
MGAAAARVMDDFAEDELRTINRVTGLSTDYFNHHNEAIMLLELIGDMPDMIDDVRAWHPVSYRSHFEDSNLGIAPAAIACYETAPADSRVAFDNLTHCLDAFLVDAIGLIGDLIDAGHPDIAGDVGHQASDFARRVVASGSALANGSRADIFPERRASEQTEALIDALF